MVVARVIGNATTTVRHRSLKGVRLLLCEVIDDAGQGTGAMICAGDWIGAGKGDEVMITSDGDASQVHTKDPHGPLRSVILGIVDREEVGVS